MSRLTYLLRLFLGSAMLLSMISSGGAQSDNITGNVTTETASRWWTRLYGAGWYDTRWEGLFLQAYAQRGYDILPDKLLSIYGIGAISRDSRSEGSGPAPAIISDNYFLVGVGVRFRPAQSFWIDAQEGLAFDLLDREGKSSPRGDFRLIATGGTGIYPPLLVHDDLRSPMTLMADFFISSGYYSRYENYITYAQARLGGRIAEVSQAFADLYIRADMAFDTEGKFYNNLFEFGPGIRVTPNVDWGLFLMVEYHRGRYADYTSEMRSAREIYYAPFYNSVRFLLVLEREF